MDIIDQSMKCDIPNVRNIKQLDQSQVLRGRVWRCLCRDVPTKFCNAIQDEITRVVLFNDDVAGYSSAVFKDSELVWIG